MRMPVAGKEMPSRNRPASSRRLMRLPRRMALRSGSSSSTARMSGFAARKSAASGGTSARFVAMVSPAGDSDQSRPPRRSCYHSARMPESHSFILTVVCPDAVGIVAAVAGYLTAQEYFIEESTHFGDPDTGTFFMRTRFIPRQQSFSRGAFAAGFDAIATRFGMDWHVLRHAHPAPGADHGLEARPLPQRPAVPLPDRRAPHDDRGHRLQPHGALGPGQLAQGALLPRAGDAGQQGGSRGPPDGDRRGQPRRPHRPGPLHAGPLRPTSVRSTRAGSSTSTTRSCPASRAPSPTTRRTGAA